LHACGVARRRMADWRLFCYDCSRGKPSKTQGALRLTAESNVRRRILDAALDIAETQGIAALTQPKVAKAAGLRQSHLTYYFPRKADLYVALLDASHERAAKKAKGRQKSEASGTLFEQLAALVVDRRRMQFFVGVVLAASEEPELRAIVSAHLHALPTRVAALFGRSADDAAVLAFVDQLRGMGFRLLLQPEGAARVANDLAALAADLGLRKATDGR